MPSLSPSGLIPESPVKYSEIRGFTFISLMVSTSATTHCMQQQRVSLYHLTATTRAPSVAVPHNEPAHRDKSVNLMSFKIAALLFGCCLVGTSPVQFILQISRNGDDDDVVIEAFRHVPRD